jgi:hypothetical protein
VAKQNVAVLSAAVAIVVVEVEVEVVACGSLQQWSVWYVGGWDGMG